MENGKWIKHQEDRMHQKDNNERKFVPKLPLMYISNLKNARNKKELDNHQPRCRNGISYWKMCNIVNVQRAKKEQNKTPEGI